MTPMILRRYIASLFLRWILGLFAGTTLLAFLIDLLEVLRGNADKPDLDYLAVVAVSALRIPLITEQILPFAVLIGSIAAFLSLSRRSELVVCRAAGWSVWQFAAPGIAVALAIGVLATLVYNPLATAMRQESDRIAAAAFGSVASILSDASSEAWLRQSTPDGEAIMSVEGIADGGRTILEPVFWVFDGGGRLSRRVDAVIGTLHDDRWELSEAVVTDLSGVHAPAQSYDLATSLTPEQVRDRLSSPDAVSFWRLPSTITQATASGLPPYRFRLQFHVLLSRPLLLASMVLIAATVSLGLARSGQVGRMILGGVVAGFMLYVVTEIARDLGSEGLVPAVLAAWAPGVAATLFGVTSLLYREDG